MKPPREPPISPAHAASLATTAGITAVITVVATISLLAQCAGLTGHAAVLGAGAVCALMAGAGGLYAGRNAIGRALDLTPLDGAASAVVAAKGLARFHLGMAGVFTGSGLGIAARLGPSGGAAIWAVAAVAGAAAVFALARGVAWSRESRVRIAEGVRMTEARSEAKNIRREPDRAPTAVPNRHTP